MEGKNILDNDKEHAWGRPVYCEGMLYGTSKRSLIFDHYKVIFDEQASLWQLYDLRTDPLEKRNISADFRSTAYDARQTTETARVSPKVLPQVMQKVSQKTPKRPTK
ncbi:MAG: hypothetical protein MZV70_42000 [Desulfobacterales bacterium]|nr:hypothetical protein [Desulfobacterales bacterium]